MPMRSRTLADLGCLSLRGAGCLALAVLLAGCFLSPVPAITEATAEDVGPVLEYAGEDPENGGGAGERIRFARLADREYQMQFVASGTDAVEPYRQGIFLRRLGSRGDFPVFLVQHDTYRDAMSSDYMRDAHGDDRFEIYPVAIRPDGVGLAASVDCAGAEVRARAALHGIDLRCEDWAGMCLLPRIYNHPDAARVFAYLQEILDEGLFEWEDNGGLDIFGRCLQ